MQRTIAFLALAATFSGLAVNGSPDTSAFRSRDVSHIAGYKSVGCWTDSTALRSLQGYTYFDDAMTNEKCATACTGFKYFATEYGRECYCGEALAISCILTEASECSFVCPGDSTQTCGAGDRLNVFVRSEDATPSTSSSSVSATPTSEATSSSMTSLESSTVTSTEASTTTEIPSSSSTTEEPTTSSTLPATTPVSTTSIEPSTSSSDVPSTTSEIPSSSSTTELPTTSSTTTFVSTTTSGSTTTTVSTTTTSVTPPTPTNVIANGDFEGTGGWTNRQPYPRLVYNFADTDSPHSGSQAGSLTYALGSLAYPAWFEHPITLLANTKYNFSAWTKVSAVNFGCTIHFYIGSADSASILKIMVSVPTGSIRNSWTQSVGTFDSVAAGQYTVAVRMSCLAVPQTRTYFFDDLSLTVAA